MNDGANQFTINPAQEMDNRVKPDSWIAKIKFIQGLIYDDCTLISVLGEQNGGKTTFAKLLCATIDHGFNTHLFTASSLFDSEIFLAQIKAQLNFSGEATLANFINQSQHNQIHNLIVIDNAEHLSEIFIVEILSALEQQDNPSYFHICLISNVSLVTTLNTIGLTVDEDKMYSLELGNLSESETTDYIKARLQSSPNLAMNLTEERLKQFYQLTEGNIAQINSQMTSFFNKNMSSVLPNAVRELLKGISRDQRILYGSFLSAALLVLGIITYFWQSPATTETPVAQSQVLTMAIEMPPRPTVLHSEIPPYFVAASRQAIQPTPMRRAELVGINEEDTTSDDSLVVMDKVVVAPKVIQQAVKETAVKNTKIAAKTIQSTIAKTHYAIQLLASHNKKELERFAINHHIRAKTTIFRTQIKGKDWYILTLGGYEKRDSAKKAVKQLPREFVHYKPWIRDTTNLKKIG